MKPPILIFVAVGLAFWHHASCVGLARPTHPLQPNAPRTVTVSEVGHARLWSAPACCNRR